MHNTRTGPLSECLSEREEEIKPYRYVRTFNDLTRQKTVSEMDKGELQSFISQILGSKGLETVIAEAKSS